MQLCCITFFLQVNVILVSSHLKAPLESCKFMENKIQMELLITIGFPLVAAIFYGLLLRELHTGIQLADLPKDKKKRTWKRIIITLVAWTLMITALSVSGFLSDFTAMPPRPTIVIIIPLILIILATRSTITSEILKHIPPQNLIRLQSFRIFVEVLLWMLFVENLVPVQMTFEGRNFDILSGITALIIVWFMRSGKVPDIAIILWNFVCLGLLINIVGVAILSMPLPFRVFMNEPANTVVMTFPEVLLPGLLVPLAYGLHFISLKQALLKKGKH